jgi:hypothetical protein
MAPFLWSAIGIGYEQHTYLWTGFGVWTQLWASVTLPLAWGFSWRWIRDGRHALAAVTLSVLTIALHFETGHLALIPLLLWPFVADRPIARRIRRAAVALAGALLASAWVIVPLLGRKEGPRRVSLDAPVSGHVRHRALVVPHDRVQAGVCFRAARMR